MHSHLLVAQLAALQETEQFIAGFESDAAQQPAVANLLDKLRIQISVTTDLLNSSSKQQSSDLTLVFTEWQCGHHQQRPASISCSNIEQANLIAYAISHAISQPGHARAVLMSDTHATDVYITDDYVRSSSEQHGFQPDFLTCSRSQRPVIIYGCEAEIELIHSEQLSDAAEWIYGGTPTRWNGRDPLDDQVNTSTLTLEQLTWLFSDADLWSTQPALASFPPVLMPAHQALVALQAEVAEETQQFEGRVSSGHGVTA